MKSAARAASARPTLVALALALAAFVSAPALASPDARSTAEIDQILTSIANSGCTFIREGKEYSGADARKHLETKLGFARSRIDTAEQFISYLASKSSTTGNAYHIRCGATDTVAQTWLDTQLKTIRGRQ
jgi:hypothetical protein